MKMNKSGQAALRYECLKDSLRGEAMSDARIDTDEEYRIVTSFARTYEVPVAAATALYLAGKRSAEQQIAAISDAASELMLCARKLRHSWETQTDRRVGLDRIDAAIKAMDRALAGKPTSERTDRGSS